MSELNPVIVQMEIDRVYWKPQVDALAARLAEARGLLRETLDALPTASDYESRVDYLKNLRTRVDAFLAEKEGER